MSEIPLALTYDDVLLVPQRSTIDSRSKIILKTKLTKNFEINFPIISVNMETVTGVDLAIAMSKYGAMSFFPRFKEPTEQAKDIKKILDAGERVIPAIGIKDEEFIRARELIKVGAQVLTVDVAHGHLERTLYFVEQLKKEFTDIEIIAGVIATYEGARDLFEAGADAVRVGVGPGTICTTRQVTGSGVPQVTAIMDAYRAGKEYDRPVIADGGTKTTGDLVKALAAGGNAVVTGSQLAGTEETPGDVIEMNGKKHKAYNGSTSKTEKVRQYKQYSQDKTTHYVEYVEGIESYVPYKGSVENVLNVMDKGIRSGLSYSGALTVEELHQKAKFIRVTQSSIQENGAHGVVTNIQK